MRRITAAIGAAVLLALGVLTGTAVGAATTTSHHPAQTRATYLNPHARIADRVDDLLGRMTLAEKIGQMDQIVLGKLRGPSNPSNGDCNGGNSDQLQQSCLEKVLISDHTGSILSGGTDNPPDNTGHGWAELINAVQHYAIDHSRLHIPVIYGVDAVHGFGHPFEATLFPQSIGMGATWDTSLARDAGAATQQQLVATGGTWDFAPVQDLARDNRWGRYYETWAEEPMLAGAMGGANIAGMQGASHSGKLKVAATVKHFAGYSQSINGHDRVEEQLPIRYLQDTFLPSYAAGIDAGAATVMVNSGSINSVPATASHFLLTTELRQRLGFKGVVISDYGDVPALQTAYHVSPDLADAVAKAVNAGVDMAMEPDNPSGWNDALLEDVHNGSVSVSRINQSVRRILTLKFRLGLFDHPYVDPSQADAAVTGNKPLARQAADESVTLLRNEGGVLPLSKNASKLVVTGPNANSMTNQLGGWSVSWQGAFGANQACCAGPADQIPPGTTVLDGIKQAVSPSTNVVYTQDQSTAVSETNSADAAVVVVGETPYAEGLGDDPAPQLKPDQQALISALEATGKPVIVVVIAGRPLGLGPAKQANGLLMAYLPGTEGGAGVADVLFGTVNPSGHLPVSWPTDAPLQQSNFNPGGASTLGDQPKFFDQLPGTNSGWGSGYNPLYPFGYGLSYTTFKVSGLSASSSVSRHGSGTATFTVANNGSRDGVDVVPVYVHQPTETAGIVVPPQRLVGFARVEVPAGGSKTVHVRFPASSLALTPADIDGTEVPKVLPGSYQVQVEGMSADFTIG
ncbi:MAG TPA: glycoside hydrolase family 3 N-terminal domain-containing protein [Thermoleophilaceae bacterium]|jgi:beta-glucosidase